MEIGTIITGSIDSIIIRKKSDVDLEIGELIYTQKGEKYLIYQIYDITYSSQQNIKEIEHIAGILLEKSHYPYDIKEKYQRFYEIAYAKPLLEIDVKEKTSRPIKNLPPFFSKIHRFNKEIATLLSEILGGTKFAKLKSGKQEYEVEIPFDITQAINYHILITATTGRGKSNLLKTLAWQILENPKNTSLLILDPHNEYIGIKGYGLKDHKDAKEKIVYYSTTSYNIPLPNKKKLEINIKLIEPKHLISALDFSEAQQQAMYVLWQEQQENWLIKLLEGFSQQEIQELKKNRGIMSDTIEVLRRKMLYHLNINLNYDANKQPILIDKDSIFKINSGESTINHILTHLKNERLVIIDSSTLSSSSELILLSLIANELFREYKTAKFENTLKNLPKIGIILEEAPRILGKEMLKKEGNIFGSIAREGRKFNIGLVAVTQMPSLIPEEILANMNTKIILGTEMQKEKNILINSAPQDLSKDSKIISGLEPGEAIISSIFTKFPIPIKTYKFEELVEKHIKNHKEIKTKNLMTKKDPLESLLN